jgi:hypothetical protein
MAAGPATQPSCAMAQASDSTPEPITAVMMWELAVHSVPVRRGRPSSSRYSACAAFPASMDTSIGATTACCCFSCPAAIAAAEDGYE